MTVLDVTPSSGPYTHNGVTTVYNYSFKLAAAADLVVYYVLSGVTTTLNYNSGQFTVQSVGSNTGTFTLSSAAIVPTGASLYCKRSTPVTQPTDLQNQGEYFAEVVEAEFDRGRLIDQEFRRDQDVNTADIVALKAKDIQLQTDLDIVEAAQAADRADINARTIAPSPLTVLAYGNSGAPQLLALSQMLTGISNFTKRNSLDGARALWDNLAAGSTWLDDTVDPMVFYQRNGAAGNWIGPFRWSITDKQIINTIGYDSPMVNGAVGNGVADDTTALNAVFSGGFTAIHLGYGKTYRITNTVTIPVGVSVDFGTSKIVYAGTRDRPAVVWGADGALPQEAKIDNVWIEASIIDVSNDAFVGLKTFNVQRTEVNIRRITGFTHLVEFVSKGQGVTGMTMRAAFLGTCKYAFTTTSDASAFNYVNANTFEVEDWTVIAVQPGNAHGWYSRGVNRPGAFSCTTQNGNKIIFRSIQPGNGSVGEIRNAAFLDDMAGQNIIRVERFESGRGAIATIVGGLGDGINNNDIVAANNVIEIGPIYQAGGAILETVTQTGSARLNILKYINEARYSESEIRVDDLVRKLKSYSATQFMATGGLHVTFTGGLPVQVVTNTNVEFGRRSILLGTGQRSIGFFVDVNGGETFLAWADTVAAIAGAPLIGVQAFDSAGALLTYPGGVVEPAIKSDAAGRFNRWSADMGGSFVAGGVNMAFTCRSDVRRLRVFVYGGGAVRGFGIRRLTQGLSPLVQDSGLNNNPNQHYVSGDPTNGTFGIYGRGDLALLDTASGAGLDGYQYTTAGFSCVQWAASTAVVVGQLRYNGANVYECTTAGTTAGAGGPTGTGTGIADGTAVWSFVSTRAAATLV